jgi:ABC-type multidrug transport system permease subunit
MLGFFLGTLYLDLERSEEYIEDRVSVLFFVAGFLTFMSISALPVFIEARAVYNRETFSEYYGPGAYVISASVAPLPILVFISLICCLVHYFAINLNQHDDSRFIFYVAALYVALYGSESLIVMTSAALPEFSTALVASACFFGASMLFCGFFILRENIPDYYIWITYGLSIHNYYFVALMVNEFNDINFKASDPEPNPASSEPADLVITGESVLEDYGYEDETRGFNFMMMIIMSVVFRIFFYLALKFEIGGGESR